MVSGKSLGDLEKANKRKQRMQATEHSSAVAHLILCLGNVNEPQILPIIRWGNCLYFQTDDAAIMKRLTGNLRVSTVVIWFPGFVGVFFLFFFFLFPSHPLFFFFKCKRRLPVDTGPGRGSNLHRMLWQVSLYSMEIKWKRKEWWAGTTIFWEECPVLILLGFFKRGRDSRDGSGLSAQL